jgi:glycerol-3-phosphate acyltransferase PlsY
VFVTFPVIFQFQASMAVATIAGMLSVVVWMVRAYAVVVVTAPLDPVTTVGVSQATSRAVTYEGKLIVTGLGSVNGGKMKLQGGTQAMVGLVPV